MVTVSSDSNKQIMLALLYIAISFAGLCHAKVLHIKHAPPYIVLQQQGPDNKLSSSNLPNVLAGPLGIKSQSSAIRSNSLFKRPAANVLFTLVTHKDQDIPMSSLASYPMEMDTPYVDVEQLMNSLQRKFLDKEPLMLDLLSDNQLFDLKTSSSLFRSLPHSLAAMKDRLMDADSVVTRLSSVALNSSVDSDSCLYGEMQIIEDVISTLKKNTDRLNPKTPDLLSFTLTGMKAVADEHGVGSDQAKEAEEIVSKHIDMMTEELKSIYGGNVMVEVVIAPSPGHGKIRRTRSLMAVAPTTINPRTNKHLNLALDWYEDFPVSFNIILWLMVILIITVIFVAYGIWNMNPNLESILYRVPQDELKKTN